jgi:hypothetical protein
MRKIKKLLLIGLHLVNLMVFGGMDKSIGDIFK